MSTLQSRARLIIWIVVIVVILGILAFFWINGSGSPTTGTPGTNTTSSLGAESGAMTTVTSTPSGNTTEPSTGKSAGSGSGSSKSGSSAETNPSIITINLITPVSGITWTIGQPNVIAWSQAAGVTGEIDLVNAQTGALIGVILSETGPNQTSYSWNARSIYAARYSAEQHDVVAGTYAIRIHFDGNGFGSLVSGPIIITK